MHDADSFAAEWAARADLAALAYELSSPNQDTPTARAARIEWDRRTDDAHTLRAAVDLLPDTETLTRRLARLEEELRTEQTDSGRARLERTIGRIRQTLHRRRLAEQEATAQELDDRARLADGRPTSDELADDPTPTVSERIRRRRAARAAVTGGIVIPPDRDAGEGF